MILGEEVVWFVVVISCWDLMLMVVEFGLLVLGICFIGCCVELDWVVEFFGDCCLLMIVGLGGCGKICLLYEVVCEVSCDYLVGIYVVELVGFCFVMLGVVGMVVIVDIGLIVVYWVVIDVFIVWVVVVIGVCEVVG